MVKTYQSPNLIVQAHDPKAAKRRVLVWACAWVLGLGLMYWLGTQTANPPDVAKLRQHTKQLEAQLKAAKQDLEKAAQEHANLTRGNQILQTANSELQHTITSRDDEINRLRTDNGFYERLVGGNSRQGLTMHEFRVRQSASPGTWLFDMTLLQNLKKGANVNGVVAISVEGKMGDKLTTLAWKDLAAKGADTPKFSFKYFQHVEGSFMLPTGFLPTRVLIKANADTGEKINSSVAWQDAQNPGA